MASEPETTVSTEEREFLDRLLGLLNSSWPHRCDVNSDTAKRAKALVAQLRNWNSWK